MIAFGQYDFAAGNNISLINVDDNEHLSVNLTNNAPKINAGFHFAWKPER